ncbi:MAG: GxxExxY protein [Verrucomicrobiota bacterium]
MTHDPQTYSIIGAAMEVHRQLGCGFLESVYGDALVKEFEYRGVAYRREVTLPIYYKGELLPSSFRADFLCFESIVVELKALKSTGPNETAQIINQLKASGIERGLLINFGASSLHYKRFIEDRKNLCPSVKSVDESESAKSADFSESVDLETL